jgi:hypothetical protein
MKLAIILDHKVHSDLKDPRNKQPKEIGHGVIAAYQQ